MADERRNAPADSDMGTEIRAWRAAAIAGAVITLIVAVSVGVWVFTGDLPTDAVGRARAFTPFGAIMLAAVTLLTVIWRASLTERQTHLQWQQIAANERSHLSDLLQRGIELLSDDDHTKQMTGIVTLEVVATAGNHKLAIHAMDILVDFLEFKFENNHNGALCSAAITALRAAHELSRSGDVRQSARTLRFSANEKTSNVSWKFVEGVERVVYEGGSMAASQLPTARVSGRRDATLELNRVKISDGQNLRGDIQADDCIFDNCKISGPVSVSFLCQNHFRNCEFSGADMSELHEMIDIRDGDNFFFADSPPTASKQIEWDKHLKIVRR